MNPYVIADEEEKNIGSLFHGDDYKKDFLVLKSQLDEMGYSVPTLFKQYGELCEPGGVMFSDFNIDPKFCDCVDGFVIVDTEMARASKRKRYMGIDSNAKTSPVGS